MKEIEGKLARACISALLHVEDAAQTLALVQDIDGSVDIVEFHLVGNIRVEFELALHATIDQAGHLRAALEAAKRSSAPNTPGDKLERAGGNLLASSGDTNDARLSPAFVGALESAAHYSHVSCAVKAKIDTSIGHFYDHFLHRFFVAGRVDAVCCAPFFGHGKLGFVDVHCNDPGGAGNLEPLDDSKAYRAEAKHCSGCTFVDFAGVPHCAPTGGHAATKEADFVQRRLLVFDLGAGNFVDDCIFAKRRGSHKVVDGLSFVGKARLVVAFHDAATGPHAHSLAQICFGVFAKLALVAIGLDGA